MKAFIFVALVASVAARGLDFNQLRYLGEQKSLLNRPVVSDVLLKDQLINRVPLERNIVGDIDTTTNVLPVDQTVDTIRGVYDVDRVLTFEEIYNTVLFRQYLQIPLFRQYIQYPSFQRYVASIYFQRFYQIPAFRQYFLNPVLFYKYIYPIVQLFTSEYTIPTTYGQSTGIYGQQYDDVLGLQNIVDDVVVRNRNVLPYVYNYNKLPYGYTNARYGQQYLPYTTATTNYKFLLEKLYKSLYVNQPTVGDYTEVQTDVKVLPGDKKVVVEPITGEQKVVVEDPKIVDVKVDQKIVPVEKVQVPTVDTTVVPTVDVVVLKQLLKLNIITPVVYEQILLGKIDLYQYLLQRQIITPEIYQLLVLQKVDIYTVLRQVLGIDIVRSDYVTPVTRDFDSVVDYPVNRFDRTNLVNKVYNYDSLVNQEIPTIRRNNLFNRLPLQNILRDIVA